MPAALAKKLVTETREEYRLFLSYCTQGPNRSLKEVKKQFPEETRINWLCGHNRWYQRSVEWDLQRMIRDGDRFMKHYMASMSMAAKKVYHTLKDFDVGTKEWNAAIKTLEMLGDKFPEEGPRLMAQRAGLGTEATDVLQLPGPSPSVPEARPQDSVDVGSDGGGLGSAAETPLQSASADRPFDRQVARGGGSD